MSRLPSSPAGQAIKPSPDLYTVLLLVALIMMLWAGINVLMCLTGDYGMSFGQLFSPAQMPK